ncbi:hypothetical protein LguiB_014065 [Lonicera macranthoides]
MRPFFCAVDELSHYRQVPAPHGTTMRHFFCALDELLHYRQVPAPRGQVKRVLTFFIALE